MAGKPIEATANPIQGRGNGEAIRIVWSNVGAKDECAMFDLLSATAEMCESVQVDGDFGSGSCEVHGSNDGRNSYLLGDCFGSAARLLGPGIVRLNENTLFIRPVVDGDETTKLTITLFARKSK